MKYLRFGLTLNLSIILICFFTAYPSLAIEKQNPIEGRYQLFLAQYVDDKGNVHPIVYRIDTITGNTNIIEYTVEEISGKKVRFFYFGEVHKDTEELLIHIKALKEVFEKK